MPRKSNQKTDEQIFNIPADKPKKAKKSVSPERRAQLLENLKKGRAKQKAKRDAKLKNEGANEVIEVVVSENNTSTKSVNKIKKEVEKKIEVETQNKLEKIDNHRIDITNTYSVQDDLKALKDEIKELRSFIRNTENKNEQRRLQKELKKKTETKKIIEVANSNEVKAFAKAPPKVETKVEEPSIKLPEPTKPIDIPLLKQPITKSMFKLAVW